MYKQKAVEGGAEGVTDKDATTLTDPLHSSDSDYVSDIKHDFLLKPFKMGLK